MNTRAILLVLVLALAAAAATTPVPAGPDLQADLDGVPAELVPGGAAETAEAEEILTEYARRLGRLPETGTVDGFPPLPPPLAELPAPPVQHTLGELGRGLVRALLPALITGAVGLVAGVSLGRQCRAGQGVV